ncbi:hypothetical protein [Mycobacterium genavense]|uniref:hypothetical protein n=1 Tax=Mycobacterium genavense TaxID=36812 RepID=UPI001FE0F1A5|nr:hypothetical protein [Mycobacterium genavense]
MTQRTKVLGVALEKFFAASRASVDLPTPSGPSTTAPRRVPSAKAEPSCSNVDACCGTFRRIGIAEFYCEAVSSR